MFITEKLSSPIYFVNKWIAARLTPSEGYLDRHLSKKSSAANACETKFDNSLEGTVKPPTRY